MLADKEISIDNDRSIQKATLKYYYIIAFGTENLKVHARTADWLGHVLLQLAQGSESTLNDILNSQNIAVLKTILKGY